MSRCSPPRLLTTVFLASAARQGRLTDRGLAALSGLTCKNLRKLNTVGAYKCTDAALQCLLQSHPTILLYHKPEKFGEGFTE